MRKLLYLAILLCSSLSWAAAPVFVIKSSAKKTASNTSVAVTVTTTAGNLGVVICGYNGTTGTISVADGGTDTFTATGSIFHSTSEGYSAQVFYAQSLAGGSKTITCTVPTNTFSNIWYYEYSGQNATALDVGTTGADSTGGNSATPTVTITAGTNIVMVGAVACGNTCSIGTCTPNACTNSQTDASGDLAADQANAAGGSTALKASQTSGAYAWVAATFKGSSGGVTCTQSIALMGVGCR